MRVLCISPSFVPSPDPEAFCGGKMVNALVEAGVDVTVLCAPLSPEHPADSSSCWKQLQALTRHVETPPTWRGEVGEVFSEVYYGLSYRNPGCGRHVKNYVRWARELHRVKRFDAVYSRSLPMMAHIAGYWCSRALGLPWIANINDPWDTHLYPETKPKPVTVCRAATSRYWLHRTLRYADLITYPSSRLHRFHEQLAGVRHKAAVISHIGYAVEPSNKATTEFQIVHAGRLRGLTGRSSVELLAGLAKFLRACPFARGATRVILVGREDPATRGWTKRFGLGGMVQCVGRVPYEESLKYIASASVCVLVEGKMTNGIYFPSKLADYVVARKPVLSLSPACGVIAEMARGGGIRRVDPDDEEAIASALDAFYRMYLEGRLREDSPPDTLVREVSPTVVVEKFLRAVEAIIPACPPEEHAIAGVRGAWAAMSASNRDP
jgi:hypothetical protein